MKLSAILAIRNEEAYLANCLRHLVRNEVDYLIIDNDSTDGSAEIYHRKEFSANLINVVTLPYTGEFSLRAQLRLKMAVIETVEADWVLHVDADEMPHSYRQDETLKEAISRLDAGGANVVNFEEFVFLPLDGNYASDIHGFPDIRHYYFFAPRPLRLMRAWRKANGFSLLEGGGHTLDGHEICVASESLALRHYIVLNQQHAYRKYTARTFAAAELADGWHRIRAGQPEAAFRFPVPDALKRLENVNDCDLDRSAPWAAHYWLKAGGS